MKDVYVIRGQSDEKQTLGVLIAPNFPELFIAKTLELPWKDNANDISCISLGDYVCRYTQSPHMTQIAGQPVFTYEILNVPNRSGVRIHSANYFNQLLGCIALGDVTKDINSDNELDVIHSGATVEAFVNLMNKEDFTIHILHVASVPVMVLL